MAHLTRNPKTKAEALSFLERNIQLTLLPEKTQPSKGQRHPRLVVVPKLLRDYTGRIYVCGPHYPAPRTWYGYAIVEAGIVKGIE